MRINLKDLREKAQRRDDSGKLKSMTREELSLMLEEAIGRKLHVNQIARYEEEPGNVPVELLISWLRCLGTTFEEQVLRASSAQPDHVIDPGAPYDKLRSRVSLLLDYLENAQRAGTFGELPHDAPGFENIESVARQIGRKPNLVLSGAFDVGKSTLANWLMASDGSLPTQYQPTTAVVTYVRHIEDKPAWLREEVVLVNGSFDPAHWDCQEHVEHCRIVSGNLESLRQYGTHAGDRFASSGAEAALVFIDSPLLKGCNLVDYPGYQNNEEDSLRADKATRNMDVLIYASTVTGFMDAQDMARLRYLLKALPEFERLDAEFPVLGNLFVVATHAGPQISDADLFGAQGRNGLLDIATERIWRELKELELQTRATATGRVIDRAAVRTRIFPFWRENASRTSSLASRIGELLSSDLPRVVYGEADRKIEELKNGAARYYSTAIESYQQVLRNIDEAKALYAEKMAQEPARRQQAAERRAQIVATLERIKEEHKKRFSEEFGGVVELSAIEGQIRQRYDGNKKEAQQFMAGFLVGDLQGRSEKMAKEYSQEVAELIEQYVSSYDRAAGLIAAEKSQEIEIPFDARGSFIGGLAGLGSIGALSLWASSLGNLGSYIIAAKAVSILSGLGIATGGTASVMALLSAVGGPVTLGIGIAVAVFFGLKALFGEAWQARLARQIVDHFNKNDIEGKFRYSIAQFWDRTRTAFEKGADKVEEDFVAELMHLGAVLEEPEEQERAMRLVSLFEAAKDFFANMPWIPIPSRALPAGGQTS